MGGRAMVDGEEYRGEDVPLCVWVSVCAWRCRGVSGRRRFKVERPDGRY